MTTFTNRAVYLTLLLVVVVATALLGQDTILFAHDDSSFVDNQVERLKLQHRLDYDAPLYNATFIGTHNSFSARHEGFVNELGFPKVLNHHADMVAQLEAGARLLNYDLHAKGVGKKRRVALCHTVLTECPKDVLDFKDALSELAD